MDTQFNELLFTRHSIRRYKDESIEPDKVKQILEAALLSPSSKSARPWQFTVIEDRETLELLSHCKTMGSKPIAGAALAVVISADPAKSDVYVEDCSVAATMMLLQAHALGVGACWIQVRQRYGAGDEPAQDLVKRVLNIPDEQQVVVIITLGISDEQRKPVDPSKLQWEKVHIGPWSDQE